MKVGDLVILNGTQWSSYDREGEIGLLLETELMTERSGYPDAEFSRVMWKDGKVNFCKSEHLCVLNEAVS